MPGAVLSHIGCAVPGNCTSNQHATPCTTQGPLQVKATGISMSCRSVSSAVSKSIGVQAYGAIRMPGSNESITTLPQYPCSHTRLSTHDETAASAWYPVEGGRFEVTQPAEALWPCVVIQQERCAGVLQRHAVIQMAVMMVGWWAGKQVNQEGSGGCSRLWHEHDGHALQV